MTGCARKLCIRLAHSCCSGIYVETSQGLLALLSRENRAAYLFLWRCSTEMTREESSEIPNFWENTRKDGELSV